MTRAEVPRAEAHGDRVRAAKRSPPAPQRRATDSRPRYLAHAEAERFLRSAVDRLALSARGSDRVGRVAATVAALAGREQVGEDDVAEALGYRLEVTR